MNGKSKRRTLKDINQEELKQTLKYFPKTGNWKWKKTLSNNAKKGKYAGCLDKTTGYILIGFNGKLYLSHRLAWLYMEGYFPENDVDHRNRIKNDNRWCNLRHVSRTCNMRNCNLRKTNKSNVIGVTWHKHGKGWTANITLNYKQKNIGFYKYKKDAVKARWEAEKEYNFPDCNISSTSYLWLKKRGLI